MPTTVTTGYIRRWTVALKRPSRWMTTLGTGLAKISISHFFGWGIFCWISPQAMCDSRPKKARIHATPLEDALWNHAGLDCPVDVPDHVGPRSLEEEGKRIIHGSFNLTSTGIGVAMAAIIIITDLKSLNLEVWKFSGFVTVDPECLLCLLLCHGRIICTQRRVRNIGQRRDEIDW